MGTIDRATITLTCPGCGLREARRVLDKGSGWGGSNWQLPSFSVFQAAASGGGKDEPEVSATCPQCGTVAEVHTQYAT